MGLIAARDLAEKWGISQRRVSILCVDGRIPGARRVGNMWVIPDDAQKPVDGRTLRYAGERKATIKPFIKWAGGKGQLLSDIRRTYPTELGKRIRKYAEPFVGGGAVLFDVLSTFDLDSVYISDINPELINTYKTIQNDVDLLIESLTALQESYLPLDEDGRKAFYYKQRDRFNDLKINSAGNNNIELASLFIFLNRTCFNGLYRVNRSNLFNVPMGRYKNPIICDDENLRNISSVLNNVTIVCGDYRESASFVDNDTFVYFDPPYRPLTVTSAFTSYTDEGFDDSSQIELAEYVQRLDDIGASIVVSNSDPKNTNPDDNFFDNLYARQKINRVEASRMINSNGNSRGKIRELLICNY